MKKDVSKHNRVTLRLTMTALLGAWFACLFVESFLSDVSLISPTFVHGLSHIWFVASWAVVTAVLLLYGSISATLVKWFSLGATALYSLRAAYLGHSAYLAFALCGVLAAMWLLCDVELPSVRRSLSLRGAVITLSAIGTAGFAFMLGATVLTYDACLTPSTGSTGLYNQMLWSMKETFAPGTTLEFGEAANHFAAHISPIFYIYLPFYALVPSPVTLMVLQSAAVASAVIPLYLIARHHQLTRGVAVLMSGTTLLLPSVLGGALGGLHELSLLLPLLLWLLWALEKEHLPLAVLFAVLCLCVRESAGLYVFTVGLYWLLSHGRPTDGHTPKSTKKHRMTAVILMAVSLIYFISAMAILTYAGKGTLITRFANVTGEYNTSFWTLCWEMVMNPAIILHEMWSMAKLQFLLCLLLPLGFLPLRSRHKAGLVFLIPLLLVNLIPDSIYQYSLDFPYGFGVAAPALYLATVTLADRRNPPTTKEGRASDAKGRLLPMPLCCALVVCAFLVGDRCADNLTYAVTAREEIDAMQTVLDAVPDDASVSASGYLIPRLSGRAEIYRLDSEVNTDYVVLDLREGRTVGNDLNYYTEYYQDLGYTVVTQEDGVAVLLKKG